MQVTKWLNRTVLTTGLMFAALQATTVQAHGVSEVMDPQGNVPGFTALARVTCYDDGNGNAAYLVARVRDKSEPVEGLRLTVHLLKDNRAENVTDTTPGDAEYSEFVALERGNGVYQMMLTKTSTGARAFDLEWHCMTENHIHTGTDILVDQYD